MEDILAQKGETMEKRVIGEGEDLEWEPSEGTPELGEPKNEAKN